MNSQRFRNLTQKYGKLRVAVVGDFCLDRYLEIDSAKRETSLETGLPVHNVVNVRSQPGGAGTIVANLTALRLGKIFPVGFCGEDGHGFELQRALGSLPNVSLQHFFATPLRHTFTYTKPLVLQRGPTPLELNRLDVKNWTPTPQTVQQNIARSLRALARQVDALIVLDQTDVAQTGVVAGAVLKVLGRLARGRSSLPIVADSRRGLRDFPPLIFKLNATELAPQVRSRKLLGLKQMKIAAVGLARKNRRPVFITLAEDGMLGALPDGTVEHARAIPARGPIDIVGAGDAVTANLAVALAAGATLHEAMELANAAASVVIHQLGTTGTASVAQIRRLLA